MSKPAFSFPVDVAVLSNKGRDYTLTADDAARDRLARELGLESLGLLKAQVSIAPAAGGAVEITGRFEADVVQACVVTLKPVASHLAEDIVRRFVPEVPAREMDKREHAKGESADDAEEWVDPDADAPDFLVDGMIDLGEVVTEELSLALDPYPRAPGATFAGLSAEKGGAGGEGPFAALAALKAGKTAPRRADHNKGVAAKTQPRKGKPVR